MSTLLRKFEKTLHSIAENPVDFINNLPSPRFLKTHLPFGLLPTELDKIKPKIIYTCRNPKDMCVSFFHHCSTAHNYKSTFEEFCELLLLGLTPLGPVFPHYLYFWNRRHESNFLFLMYEDMKKDLRGTLKKIARFLDKSYSEREYDQLCHFLSFENMKNNKGCNIMGIMETKFGKDYLKGADNHFIRKGMIGDWKNYMTPEMSKRFDEWIEENTRGTDLKFVFD